MELHMRLSHFDQPHAYMDHHLGNKGVNLSKQVMYSGKSSVFRDRSKLHPRYIPESLPHRERQIMQLNNIYRETLLDLHELMLVVRVLGPIGSGKTSTVLSFTRGILEMAERGKVPLRFVYVNCKLGVKNERGLYCRILREVTGVEPHSLSSGEYLDRLLQYLREEGWYLLLVLDDVDYLIRRSKVKEPMGGLVYDLTRLNEFHLGESMNVLGVIFIARDAEWWGLLDPSERSSLGSLVVRLSGYSVEELQDILLIRVGEAFCCGAVSLEVVDYVCDLAVGRDYMGNCRYALDLLLTAGMIAEDRRLDAVSVDHIRGAVAESGWGLCSEDLFSLDLQSVLVLRGLVQALRVSGSAYVSVRAVYEFYEMNCDSSGVSPFSYSRVRQLVVELGLVVGVVVKPGKGVGLGNVALDDLERGLEMVEKRLEVSETK